MAHLALDSIQPSKTDSATAVKALPHIRDYLDRHHESGVRLADEDGDQLVVPRGAVELFARILAHMAAGKGVSVVPPGADLTTQQAANLLNVSRPYLIGLLEAGEIEYRMVGTHRRVKIESVLEYLRNDDHRRREAAEELTRLTQDMDL